MLVLQGFRSARAIYLLFESTAVAAAGGDEAVFDLRDVEEAAGDQAAVVDVRIVAVGAVWEVDGGDDTVAEEEAMLASQSSVIVDTSDIAARVHRAQARLAVVHVKSGEGPITFPQHSMNKTRSDHMLEASTRTIAKLSSTYAVVAARDVLAPVRREPGVRRIEVGAGEDLKGPIVVKDPAVLVVVSREAPAYDVAVIVNLMGHRRVLGPKARGGWIEVGKDPRGGAEIRVLVTLRIDPATDDHALIIDASREGEDGAGVLELEVGSVRVS